MHIKKIYGQLYTESGLYPILIEYENDVVQSIYEYKHNYSNLIIPPFVNAHTHLGDCGIFTELYGNVKDVVAPPNGIKYRGYRNVSLNERMEYAKIYLKKMLMEGTLYFADFREEGVTGVKELKRLLNSIEGMTGVILGRPSSINHYNEEELTELLGYGDGIAVSGMGEWSIDFLTKVRKLTRKKGKKFTIHFSEDKRESVDEIIKVLPDYIVHLTFSTDEDLNKISDAEIPVVVCPRTNIFFGNIPRVDKILKKGITVMLGTDNCFINSPSIFREMEITYKFYHHYGISAIDIFNMVTFNSYKTFGIENYISYPSLNSNSSFIVYRMTDRELANPAYSIVNYGSADRVDAVFVNGKRVI